MIENVEVIVGCKGSPTLMISLITGAEKFLLTGTGKGSHKYCLMSTTVISEKIAWQ